MRGFGMTLRARRCIATICCALLAGVPNFGFLFMPAAVLACTAPAQEEREESKVESKTETVAGEPRRRLDNRSSTSSVRLTAFIRCAGPASPHFRDARDDLQSRFLSLRC